MKNVSGSNDLMFLYDGAIFESSVKFKSSSICGNALRLALVPNHSTVHLHKTKFDINFVTPSNLNNIPENSKCGTSINGRIIIAILVFFTIEDINKPVVAEASIDKKHISWTSQNESINIL